MKVIYSRDEFNALLKMNNKVNRKINGPDAHQETIDTFKKNSCVTVTDDHVVIEIPEGKVLKGLEVVDDHFDIIYGIAKSIFDLAQVFEKSLDSFGKAIRDVFK